MTFCHTLAKLYTMSRPKLSIRCVLFGHPWPTVKIFCLPNAHQDRVAAHLLCPRCGLRQITTYDLARFKIGQPLKETERSFDRAAYPLIEPRSA